MTRTHLRLAALAALALVAAQSDDALKAGLDRIDAKEMLRHIEVLASDEFEGRGPGTAGEDKTVAYLTEQFRRIGLKPGNPDGSYVQDVPLVGICTEARGAIKVGERTIELKTPDDWVAVSRRFAPEVKVEDSEVVFVGYGVVAPEYGWDDYKGVDVRGKTVVMLINDPAVPDPADPSKLDEGLFKGRAMTYYGRWTYKYEIASAKGAAAALIVHETGPAGYPYQVVVGSWGRENFDIPAADRNRSRVAVEAWITTETARRLLSAAGQDFEALKRAAVRKDFKPVPLGATANFSAKNNLREIKSKNVIARREGSDPKLKGECVIYTAHWDHLGRDESLQGDQIFNGAADNASGVAMMLEIAEGFAAMPPPRRSILFLAVTAEEKGLLGAKWYAEHPLYPLVKSLADINMDVINLWGRTTDITSVGQGLSTLDDLLAELARARGRVVRPDPEPEKGTYYRSDHFEFAKLGVPALNAKGGVDFPGKPAGFGLKKRDEYTQKDYHKVSDQVKPDWDLSGAVEDARLLLEVGYRIAQGESYPEWKPGAEFKARRDEMMKRAGTK
jgi:Zn-dependent M28 family amino/carboxypeptidase